MYPNGTSIYSKNLFICDSPGFGDSAGIEVDIANGVGMIDAIHGANTVRVVVLSMTIWLLTEWLVLSTLAKLYQTFLQISEF
jgi:hypothetical protein